MTVPQQGEAENRVKVAGGTLVVQRAGHGPITLWLHGWTLDHRMWRPQLALADRWTLIMPDRRGFGASDAPPDLDNEWHDITALAAGERIALIGLSQGASVALDFARRYPGQVTALVLSGAPLPGLGLPSQDAEALPRETYADQVRAGRLAEMKARWRRHPLTAVSAAARPLVDDMLNSYDGRDLRAARHQLSFTRDDLAALPMPVLAMTGEQDTAYRRDCVSTLGKLAPDCETALLPDAGHLANLDNPEAFNARVGAFLARHRR